MTLFFTILWNNVLPLSIMILIGAVMQRLFSLDIRTLSKLNFYVFSPGVMFQLLYTTEISTRLFGTVMLFCFLFFAAQYALVEIVVRLRGHRGGMRSAMRNSVLFYNSANYGIPINQLAFAGNPHTLAIQILVMVVQSLVPNTYGIYNVNAHKADWRKIVKIIIGMPVIYVIPVALALRGFQVPLPGFVDTSVGYLADAFIGTALLTLGVQLGSMKWSFQRTLALDVGLSALLRLAAGPALAWLITLPLGLDALTASALIVSSAVPTSLSSVLLAVEFDNEKEFSSQAVFFSTLFSIVTVTIVIGLVYTGT